jgi:hypothetical protein
MAFQHNSVDYLIILRRSFLLFVFSVLGLATQLLVGGLPFWEGGEAAMPLGIGGVATLVKSYPDFALPNPGYALGRLLPKRNVPVIYEDRLHT